MKKKLFLAVSFYLSNKEWKNASSRLIDNSYKITKKTEYQGVFLAQEQKLVPVTMVQINKANQFIFLFEHGKAPLAMKDIFLFLMKNREKAVYYQSKEELIPLYGVKEIENKVVI